MFDKDSALVQSWKRLIEAQRYAFADVPALGNLREAVEQALRG